LYAVAINDAINRLRFINIETPADKIEHQTDDERVSNFQFIASVLQSLNLYCCGQDPKQAESGIETKLRVNKAKEDAARRAKAK